MVRLIDANNLNFEGQNYNKSQMKAILDFVDAQPTAYDVEKVEQQIEEMFGVDAAYYGTEAKWAVEKAREIVRKGCVKNDR